MLLGVCYFSPKMTPLRSRIKLTSMSRNKEEKIYTYVVLAIGLLIWIFYFYHGYDEFLTTNPDRTEYARFFDDIFNDVFYNLYAWLLLQVLFVYSWWNLRDCIVSVLKRIHNKI